MAGSFRSSDAYVDSGPSPSAVEASYAYDGSESPSVPVNLPPARPASSSAAPLVLVSNAWSIILPYLDLPSYAVSQSTCSAWRSTAMLYNVGVQVLEKQVSRCLLMTQWIQTKLSNENELSRQDEGVVTFLAETLLLEQTRLTKISSLSTDLSADVFFLRMFDLHMKHLRALVDGLDAPKWKEFDVWNLARSLRQLEVLFPNPGPYGEKVDFDRLVRDRDGRAQWRKAVGSRNYPCVPFTSLVSALRWPAHQVRSLKSVLDFPQDGIITPYKWHVFTSLFGPWKALKANFERFIMGTGFAGCISRQRCEQLLKSLPPKSVIMRSSRTHASMLVLSYRASEGGSFVHLTNNSNFWTMPEFVAPLQAISREKGVLSSSSNVPMEYFVALFERCGYSIAPVSLNGKLPPSFASDPAIFSPSVFSSTELQNPAFYSYSPGGSDPRSSSQYSGSSASSSDSRAEYYAN